MWVSQDESDEGDLDMTRYGHGVCFSQAGRCGKSACSHSKWLLCNTEPESLLQHWFLPQGTVDKESEKFIQICL